jgi:hypothetical protein
VNRLAPRYSRSSQFSSATTNSVKIGVMKIGKLVMSSVYQRTSMTVIQ